MKKPDRLLEDEDRELWNRHGYIKVNSALSGSEIALLLEEATHLENTIRASPGSHLQKFRAHAGNDRDFRIMNAVSLRPELRCLSDHPKIFPKILALMGPCIQIAGSELLFRYPGGNQLDEFHTDGGPSLSRIFPHPDSLILHLKVQYFLTDVSRRNAGNMLVVPGTHIKPFPQNMRSIRAMRRQAIQVTAKAGDAIIFPWSIWHGVAPNTSTQMRISAIFRYSQLWSRPVDFPAIAARVQSSMSSRQRLLFGDIGARPHPGDYYRPVASDYLRNMFGVEWSKSSEAAQFFAMNAFLARLYAPSK